MSNRLSRRDFLKTLGAGTAAVSLYEYGCLPRAAKRKPNVVLIVADDLGWKDTGFMGSPAFSTPSLDRLAAEGTVFTEAYANGPNCAPSRASLLTGQYTPRHGVYTVGSAERGNSRRRKLVPVQNETVLRPAALTMVDVLKRAGYVSASVGKWHLGDDPEAGPEAHGFDLNIAGGHFGHPPQGYFAPFGLPALEGAPEGQYLTDRLTDEALKFMTEVRDRPFFLYLSHYAVHSPLQAPEGLVAKYSGGGEDSGRGHPVYAAMVEILDHSVGRILEGLEGLGLDEDTLIVFFSDNGGVKGTTTMDPLRGGKGMLYEGGIRVPLVFRWPGRVRAGESSALPVMGMDLFPTIAEGARIPLPETFAGDGISLFPAAAENRTVGRDSLYWHFPAYLEGKKEGARDPHFRTRPASAVRAGGWKLIEYFEDGQLELYNLRQDVGEKTNCVEAEPEKAGELHRRLQAWRTSCNAFVPETLNPDYDPSLE